MINGADCGGLYMYRKVLSCALCGLQARIVNVEVDVGGGLPGFDMSGYLALEVKEARERVRVAIKNSGINLNPQKIVVNISPADIRKDGTGFDLPIAIGVLLANSVIESIDEEHTLVIGELSLDGGINSVRGILSSVIEAKNTGIKTCIVPYDNYCEAAIVEGIEIIPVKSLKQVIHFLNSGELSEQPNITCKKEDLKDHTCIDDKLDFKDIRGQNVAKRATAIAVAGMHNIMYVGPPGSGKTMLAKRIPTIMPDMTFDEKLAVTNIYSVSGELKNGMGLVEKRPFRAPYHNVTKAAFLGGGAVPRPGEITLSGKGVLVFESQYVRFLKNA